MKQIYLYLMAGIICLPLLFSCEMKKELWDEIEKPTDPRLPEDAGMLALELIPEKEADLPDTRTEVADSLVADDFAVSIYNEEGALIEFYETYAAYKEEGGLLLSPGTYIVKAELGTEVNAAFDNPYYAGVDTCEIKVQEVATVRTICTLKNRKVTFVYSDDFLEHFEEDFSVVLDNGAGVLTLDKNEQRTAYLKSTGTLRFTTYLTTKTGEQLVYNYDLSRNDTIQEHNNILIDLGLVEVQPGGDEDPDEPVDPDEPTEPDPDEPADPGDESKPDVPTGKPIISVDVSLIEKDFVIEIPSDVMGGGSENPGGNGNEQPGEGDNTKIKISGVLDGAAIDFSKENAVTANSKVSVSFTFPTGLKSMKVEVNMAGLGTMNIDMLNPGELEDVFNGIALPSAGMKSYTFNITGFMSMLAEFPGSHSFKITSEDNNGDTNTTTLKLKMN